MSLLRSTAQLYKANVVLRAFTRNQPSAHYHQHARISFSSDLGGHLWSSEPSLSSTPKSRINSRLQSPSTLGVAIQSTRLGRKHNTWLRREYSSCPDSYLRNPSSWQKWVVKLLLYFNAEPGTPGAMAAVGSGFFVNIPGSKQDIIFTAGHNLISKEGNLVKAVEVFCDGTKIATVRKLGEDFHISDSYRKAPGDKNTIDDYGAILVDKERDARGVAKSREGFGMCLPLAYEDLKAMGMKAFVAGYPGVMNTEPGSYNLRYTMADFGVITEGQVHYLATTLKGQSGGPVWVLYKGYETVVGIHNHEPEEENRAAGNRATRLDLDTLMDMYHWSGAIASDRSLRTLQPGLPSEGIYLKIAGSEQSGMAVARRGKDGAATLFDILPTHTTPTDAGPVRYSFANRQFARDDPKRWMWVNFDPAQPHAITASEKISEAALVKLEPIPPRPDGLVDFNQPNPKFQIQAGTPLTPKSGAGDDGPVAPKASWAMRMEGKFIPAAEDVDEDNPPESADVRLIDLVAAKGDNAYTKFKLE